MPILKSRNGLDNQTYISKPRWGCMPDLSFMWKNQRVTTSRLKKQNLTIAYVHRHITKAREKVSDGGFSYRKGNISYQQMIADLDYDDVMGTYCYHCRNITRIGETVITHARCSLSRVYHESCGVLINLWP